MKLSSVSPGPPCWCVSESLRDTYYCAPGFAVEKGILVRQVKSVGILGRKRDTVHRSQHSGFLRPQEPRWSHKQQL